LLHENSLPLWSCSLSLYAIVRTISYCRLFPAQFQGRVQDRKPLIFSHNDQSTALISFIVHCMLTLMLLSIHRHTAAGFPQKI
jgi:hypothetical protein